MAGNARQFNDWELDAIVEQLRQIEHRAGLWRMLEMGKLIFEQFYAGSIETWRGRNAKSHSLRRLVARPGCSYSKTKLRDATALYILSLKRPGTIALPNICAGHIVAVLSLPEPMQVELLEAASKQQLSVRDLRGRAAEHRRGKGERRGRPRASLFAKAFRRARATLTAWAHLASAVEQGEGVDDDAVRRLLAELRALQDRLQAGLAARQGQRPRLVKAGDSVAGEPEPSSDSRGAAIATLVS